VKNLWIESFYRYWQLLISIYLIFRAVISRQTLAVSNTTFPLRPGMQGAEASVNLATLWAGSVME